MLGRFKESYSQVVDRLASKQLALQNRAAQIEKETLASAPESEPGSKDRIPYTTGEHVLLMSEDETPPPLYQRDLIEWRESQVLKLWSKGWSQQRIANELKVDNSTISRDLT